MEYMNLEERNYANDRRVLARGKRWWASVDEERKVATVDTEAKPWVQTVVKFQYITCPTCEGKGYHVNPSIDASGLTGEDMMDDGFREDYLSGVYNVACYHCHALRVIPQAIGNEWLEQDAGQAMRLALALARDIVRKYDLPTPPCEYDHPNCSADGLHGGTCYDELMQELASEGLTQRQYEDSMGDVWIPEGMQVDLHALHAVIANIISECEDSGEEPDVEMWEAHEASNPDTLSKHQHDLIEHIKTLRPLARHIWSKGFD